VIDRRGEACHADDPLGARTTSKPCALKNVPATVIAARLFPVDERVVPRDPCAYSRAVRTYARAARAPGAE
jgi:hypothetical protein